MSQIEDAIIDARSADGYVALFRIEEPKITGVLAVPHISPKAAYLRKLSRAISSHPRLSQLLKGYCIVRRSTSKAYIYEIRFAIREGTEEVLHEFLEYAKQARVMTNPIICDMRNFNPG